MNINPTPKILHTFAFSLQDDEQPIHNSKKTKFYDYHDLKEITVQPGKEIKDKIGSAHYKTLHFFIHCFAPQIYLKASGSKEFLIIPYAKEILLLTPSGQIYLKVGELGHGFFKSTIKMALIASTDPQKLTDSTKLSDGLKYRALSLAPQPMTDEERQNYESEKSINCYLKKQLETADLSHVNTPKSVSEGQDHSLGIMTEVLDGTLEEYLLKNSNLNMEDRLKLVIQISTAVSQLHAIKIVHRDIKPDNFLISEKEGKFHVKITDFGVSSRIEEDYRLPTSKFFQRIVDPRWHLKPFPTYSFDLSSDIYQLGIVCFQIFTGINFQEWCSWQSFSINKEEELAKALYEWKSTPENWVYLNNIANFEIRSFILKMLSVDETKRPTAQEIVSFFKEMVNKYEANPQEFLELQCVHDAKLKTDGEGVDSLDGYTDLPDSNALKPCRVD